jgi:hypothetical protein
LALVFLGLSLGPFIQATGSEALGYETNTKGSVTMMNSQSTEPPAEQQKLGKESPFACNLLALDAEGRRRHKTVTGQMRAATKETKSLPDGYAFRFSAEQSTILLVSEFIARERLCCPFLTFELVAEQDDGPLWLRLRGREGVKDFIRAEFGLK